MFTVISVVTILHYYNIIDSIPYAVLFTSVTYLFCNCKFVPPSSQILSSSLIHPLIYPSQFIPQWLCKDSMHGSLDIKIKLKTDSAFQTSDERKKADPGDPGKPNITLH